MDHQFESTKFIHKKELRLIGLKLPRKTTNKDNQSSKDCGDLWQKFEKDKIFDLIEGKLSNEIHAVYYEYEKDETGSFSYFIGCKVNNNIKIPSRLHELLIPPQVYEIYTAKGIMTGCITNTWEKIWSSNINRLFGFDFELFDDRSGNWKDAEVDLYISIIK